MERRPQSTPPPSKAPKLESEEDLHEAFSHLPSPSIIDPQSEGEMIDPDDDLDAFFEYLTRDLENPDEPLVTAPPPPPARLGPATEELYPEHEIDPENRDYVTEEGYLLPRMFSTGTCNVIRAQMGTGKTEAAKSFIRIFNERNPETPAKILIVVPRKSLATTLAKDFECVDYQALHPKKYQGDTSYVVCVNSLHLIARHISSFNVVILDEISGTIGNIFSTLMEFSLRTTTLSILHYLVDPSKYDRKLYPGQNPKTVLVMDASMGEREMTFLKDSVDPERWRCLSYYRPQKIRPLPKVVFEKCIFNFLQELAHDVLYTNKKIVIATCAKEYVGVILKLLSISSDQFLGDLRLDQDKIVRPRPSFCYFDADTPKEKIQAHLDDQELFRRYDVFVYSPVFVSGISITVEHFDKLYAVSQYGTLNSEDFIQMLARIRKLRDNSIVIGCSGTSINLPESLVTLERIEESLGRLNSESEEFRDNILSALGVSRSFYRFRGRYRDKEQYQAAIDNYFRSEIPAYQKTLMCHTVLLHLRTRRNMFDAVANAMTLNHPEWMITLSDKQYSNSTQLGREALSAILISHISELGDIKSVKTEEFLVIDAEAFEKKCERFSLLGDEPVSADSWRFRDDHIQSSFECVVPRAIDAFLMYLSPFSPWYSFIVSYCSYGDNRNFGEEMASIQMCSDLFVAMGWRDHFVTIPTPEGGPKVVCMLDHERVQNIVIDTTRILMNWKPLVAWSEKYRLNLALLGIVPLNVIDPEAVVTYKDASIAKECLLRLFSRCGIHFTDESPKITYTVKNARGLPAERKRVKRKSLKSLCPVIERFHPHLYMSNVPASCAGSNVHVPCYDYRVDVERFWRTVDVSLRRGYNLHFGKETMEALSDNMKCLGVIWENSRQNLINSIPPNVKDRFQKIFDALTPYGREMKRRPSFWILADQGQRDESFRLLEECYKELSGTMKEMLIDAFIENS